VMEMGKRILCWLTILAILITPLPAAGARKKSEWEQRQQMYERMETLTGVPWFFLAAMDQYERNIQQVRRDLPKKKGLLAISVPDRLWSGPLNPDPQDTVPESIRFFGGIGQDGNRDGKADPADDTDILLTITRYLSEKGLSQEDIRIRLWEYYQQPVIVDIITHIAKIYERYGTINLDRHSFIMPLRYNYTYHNTWGDRRGWGGLRIHEGTDIFADYGTPVLSTCYGYVELKGWNRYGGWRIGIRDTRNNYHYFAHLNGFSKNLKQGDIVEPGMVIGYVGSSGYGPPGTSGKFPPHLHYGLYKFNGRTTFSFDPYPSLKRWERDAYKRLREEKKKKRSQRKKR
jgi:peptidoglycan LD-endopeptidase LytH